MASWSAEEVRALIAEWFCPVMGHAGAVQALVSRGMADPIPPADARPGDLCQFWRRVDLASPSGHSVLFLGWGASSSGARTLRYWSSQPATDGVGPHEEEVGDGWQIHLARVRASEGDDDARFLGSDRRPATPG